MDPSARGERPVVKGNTWNNVSYLRRAGHDVEDDSHRLFLQLGQGTIIYATSSIAFKTLVYTT